MNEATAKALLVVYDLRTAQLIRVLRVRKSNGSIIDEINIERLTFGLKSV